MIEIRKNIFEIKRNLDIQKEFEKINYTLNNIKDSVIDINDEYMSYYQAIDEHVFKRWPYRDTALSVSEFLFELGIDNEILTYKKKIDISAFLNYLEFLLNIEEFSKETGSIHYKFEDIDAVFCNINVILGKMNYLTQNVDDKIIIAKNESDVTSILELVDEDIGKMLLEYTDFRTENDCESKKKIIKQIDLFLEKNIDINSFDKELKNSIGMIVNKMGVNHPITEEPYRSFTEQQLIEWYDKCFLMMLHAIRTVEVNKIKNERKQLLQK